MEDLSNRCQRSKTIMCIIFSAIQATHIQEIPSIKVGGQIIRNLQFADDTVPLMEMEISKVLYYL